VDKDGSLTLYEYALVQHLIKMKLEGQDLPFSLPANMAAPALAAAITDTSVSQTQAAETSPGVQRTIFKKQTAAKTKHLRGSSLHTQLEC